ncbi:MAG: FtsQ-type POTRA domain-containing protein [Candidatus Omnitrophica bacterium]|nr:FtsQ-type POTRA domain-containing protein [Candidatus Omnitrophota bacterium]
MATSRARRRRQRWAGLLPQLWRGLAAVGRWLWRHPQPLALACCLGLTGWAMGSFIQRAEAFHVASLSVPPNMALELPPSLIGQNIWHVNLRALSERLQQQRPDLQHVRIIRQLPNTIRVHAIERAPVAQVRIDRWYAVDRDGFILPGGTVEPMERLIRLTGFLQGSVLLRAGKLSTDERLLLALRVLAALQRAPMSIARRLTEINVSDAQQIRFVLDDELEIRCGGEAELDAHLERLQATLRMLARQPSMPIRYIDVRFQQPVVGPRAS